MMLKYACRVMPSHAEFPGDEGFHHALGVVDLAQGGDEDLLNEQDRLRMGPAETNFIHKSIGLLKA